MLQPRDVAPPPSAAARARGSPVPSKMQQNGMGRRVLGPGKALSPAVKARTAPVGNISPSASTVSLNSTFSELTAYGEREAGGVIGIGSSLQAGPTGGPMVCPICSEQMVSVLLP